MNLMFTFVVVDYRNKAFSLTQVCSEFHVLTCSVFDNCQGYKTRSLTHSESGIRHCTKTNAPCCVVIMLQVPLRQLDMIQTFLFDYSRSLSLRAWAYNEMILQLAMRQLIQSRRSFRKQQDYRFHKSNLPEMFACIFDR